MYLLHAIHLHMVRQTQGSLRLELPQRNQLFDNFITATLCIEVGYQEYHYSASSNRALQQFAMESNTEALIVHAAL